MSLSQPSPRVDSKESKEDTTVPSNEAQAKPKKRKRSKGKEKAAVEESEPATMKPALPDALRTVWVRIHPSAWQDAWDTVKEASSLTLNEYSQLQSLISGEGSKDIPEATIEIVDLRTYINCFEVMGPKSTQIIKGVFKLVNGDGRPAVREVRVVIKTQTIYLTDVQKFWNQLKDLRSPGSVPRGMIVGLKIQDPRLRLATSECTLPYVDHKPPVSLPKLRRSSQRQTATDRAQVSRLSLPSFLALNSRSRNFGM